jgi:hypothetical protein
MKNATKVVNMLTRRFVAHSISAQMAERFPIVRTEHAKTTSSIYISAGRPTGSGGMTTDVQVRVSNHPAAGLRNRRPGTDIILFTSRNDLAIQIDRAICRIDRAAKAVGRFYEQS